MLLAADPGFDLATYFPIFLYLAAIVGFAVSVLIITQLIGPSHKTPVKMMPYESGMDPVGDARQRFDVKFYLIAILFLVFDVELLFLYPWAVATFRPAPGAEAPAPAEAAAPLAASIDPFRTAIFWQVIVFLVTLAVAYVYAWRKGVFRWR
jgi:NADH-quinone oxidoreductase subunit A